MAMQPYPAHLISNWQSPQGEWITLRPIRPEDAAIEQAFVRALSPESRRFRFMDGRHELTPRMLAHFTQIDYDREMAWIVTVERSGAEIEVGVCRYITYPDGVSCEFAIVITDDWQHRGLGRRMMATLIAMARDRGLHTMIGYVLGNNHSMLNLCRELNFVMTEIADDLLLKQVTLTLNAG